MNLFKQIKHSFLISLAVAGDSRVWKPCADDPQKEFFTPLVDEIYRKPNSEANQYDYYIKSTTDEYLPLDQMPNKKMLVVVRHSHKLFSLSTLAKHQINSSVMECNVNFHVMGKPIVGSGDYVMGRDDSVIITIADQLFYYNCNSNKRVFVYETPVKLSVDFYLVYLKDLGDPGVFVIVTPRDTWEQFMVFLDIIAKVWYTDYFIRATRANIAELARLAKGEYSNHEEIAGEARRILRDIVREKLTTPTVAHLVIRVIQRVIACMCGDKSWIMLLSGLTLRLLSHLDYFDNLVSMSESQFWTRLVDASLLVWFVTSLLLYNLDFFR